MSDYDYSVEIDLEYSEAYSCIVFDGSTNTNVIVVSVGGGGQ